MGAVVFVDVDGVLSPLGSLEDARAHWPDHRPHTFEAGGRRVRVTLSRSLGRFLTDLAAEHDLELVWATTWGASANERIAPLCGLPPGMRLLAVPAATPDGPDVAAAKLELVAADAGDRPVVWIDDRLGSDAADWAAGRTAPALLVAPPARFGLRYTDLSRIDRWARTVLGST